MNVTVPVGLLPATVAVNVTGCPGAEDLESDYELGGSISQRLAVAHTPLTLVHC